MGSMLRLGVSAFVASLLCLVVSAPTTAGPNASTLKCKSGYKHAVIGGKQRCLRVGQRCATRYDRQYHRYGFHCHNGRLTRRVPPPAADLALAAKDSPDPVAAGADLTYTLTVTNRGPGVARRATLESLLDANAVYASSAASQGSCSLTSLTVGCELGQLAGGATATVSVIVRGTAAGELDNLASVRSDSRDPNPGDNSAESTTTVTAPPAPPPPPPPPPPSGQNCAPSYPDVCIPPPPPDLNCADIPYHDFRVIYTVPDPDPHGFDRDHDGIGCES